MKIKSRVVYFILLFGLPLGLAFQNCSEQSQYQGPDQVGLSSDKSEIEGSEGIRINNLNMVMSCFESSIDIGGVCNVPDGKKHKLKITMMRNGAAVIWSTGASEIYPPVGCQNGRWFASLPKPNHSDLATTLAGKVSFDVKVQMIYVDKNTLAEVAGPSTGYQEILIWQDGQCSAP